jgi:hypothetical protein
MTPEFLMILLADVILRMMLPRLIRMRYHGLPTGFGENITNDASSLNTDACYHVLPTGFGENNFGTVSLGNENQVDIWYTVAGAAVDLEDACFDLTNYEEYNTRI